jgi:hypothetical protein
MPKRTSKPQPRPKPRPDKGLDVVQNAKRVFDEAISRSDEQSGFSVSGSTISFVMAEMGRKGGKIGGKRRLETMTPERRTEIAKLAALKRWGTKKKRTK